MKPISIHILCFVMFLLSAFAVQAQEKHPDIVNDRLEQYESLCRTCLNLKQRIASGENVSRGEARSLINEFVAMNKELQSVEADMTVVQRRRFSAVSTWFSTGVEPEESFAELPRLSCRLSAGPPVVTSESLSTIAELPSLWHVDVPTAGKPDHRRDLILMASVAVPDFSYGLMAGYQYGRWGGYAGFRSNYMPHKTSYTCLSGGLLPNGSMIWYSGESRKSNLSVTVGCMFGFNDSWSMYAGAGYGRRSLAWQDVEGVWAEVSDWSHKGVALETGAIFTWKRLAVSAGISTISFKSASFVMGVGISL